MQGSFGGVTQLGGGEEGAEKGRWMSVGGVETPMVPRVRAKYPQTPCSIAGQSHAAGAVGNLSHGMR